MGKKTAVRHVYRCTTACTLRTASNGELVCVGGPSATRATIVETPGPMPDELVAVTPSPKQGQTWRRPKFVPLTAGELEDPRVGGRALQRTVVV